jgi:hypothetical protein
MPKQSTFSLPCSEVGDRALIQSLRSTVTRQTLCLGDYRKLSHGMKTALYDPLGEGYEEAGQAAFAERKLRSLFCRLNKESTCTKRKFRRYWSSWRRVEKFPGSTIMAVASRGRKASPILSLKEFRYIAVVFRRTLRPNKRP